MELKNGRNYGQWPPNHLQDKNDDESDGSSQEDLTPMLEEYRRSKQDKQARLERKAAEDGRPFSAPVESPSCDSIRRRTEGDRALKDHPPGKWLSFKYTAFSDWL